VRLTQRQFQTLPAFDVPPEYQFAERLHATPVRFAAAIEETTFDDSGVFVTLMQIVVWHAHPGAVLAAHPSG
jgi:hypothetical protein